jgi:hypothetical protein
MSVNDEERKFYGDEVISSPDSDDTEKVQGGWEARMTADAHNSSEWARLEERMCRVRARIYSDPRYDHTIVPSDEQLVKKWALEQKERRKPAQDVPNIETLRRNWSMPRETVFRKFSELLDQFKKNKAAGTRQIFEKELSGFMKDLGEVLCQTSHCMGSEYFEYIMHMIWFLFHKF